MQRYFFDVAARTYVQYDYHGREIHKPEQARELAELIALDIECTDGDDLAGAGDSGAQRQWRAFVFCSHS